MSHIVITNCTSRKRLDAAPVTMPPSASYPNIASAVALWQATSRTAHRSRLVRYLYLGRSVAEAIKVSDTLGANLYVASAGLGLAHALDPAPSYDLTFADPANSLARCLVEHGWTPADWWMALTRAGVGRGPIASLFQNSSSGLVFVALPAAYVDMISADLLAVPERQRERLRLFTSAAGQRALGAALRPCALPYDERLETVSGYAGTRTDFPQRALRHFVDVIGGHQLGLADGAERVAGALEGLQPRAVSSGTKLTDEAIADVLRTAWDVHGGSSTRLLRYLRHEARIACEQKRFRGIWYAVKGEYDNKESAV